MSGIQHFTPRALPPTGGSGHDWSKHGNPPPNNYFKTREMNVNECTSTADYYSQYPDYSYDYDYYCPDQMYESYEPYSHDYGDYDNHTQPDGCINGSTAICVDSDAEQPQATTSQEGNFRESPLSNKPK